MRRFERVLILLFISALMLLPARAESVRPPAFTLTRDLPGEYVPLGTWITLSYTARNNSEYPITALTISDSLVGEVARIDRLEPGGSKTVVARALIENDCESQPAARFALGGNMHTVSIAAAPIRIEKIDLSATLAFDVQAIRLAVTNRGNTPVYDVKAFDDALGDMGEAVVCLEPGETAVFRRKVDGGRHQVSVSAVSAAGQAVAVRSNEIIGARLGRPASDEPASLSAGREETGDVWLTLFNPGPDTWRDVILRELNAGGEQTLHFVLAGEKQRVLWTPGANNDDPLAFEATLPDGATLTASLEAAEPAAQSAEATPDPAGEKGVSTPGERSFRMEENPQTYRQMLLVTAALMGLFLLAWWISYRRRKRLARKKRIKQRQETRKKQQNKKNGEKTS